MSRADQLEARKVAALESIAQSLATIASPKKILDVHPDDEIQSVRPPVEPMGAGD